MREDLDIKLVEKFPLIFSGKYGGLCVSNGWYPILEAACYQIQGHIDTQSDRIKWANKFNEELEYARANDFEDWDEWKPRESREVPEPVPQFVATQVKEKFGTLRFYSVGGDDFTNGVICMAESMSARMCEVCSAPAVTGQDRGWIRTVCEEHS